MENPCIGCGMAWSAGRKCSCAECCESLKMWRDCMSLQKIITEKEYDMLGEQQREYWYCSKCGQYVLRSWSKVCLCDEG